MSKKHSTFLFWARTTLVLVYLVILAGSVVRATGSGMGCPDWPKCFGHYIPPTQLEQLQYTEGKEFKTGQFIIWRRALWKAKKDLTADSQINLAHWEKYTKHDYAKFNPMHTWTEYINRLCGALLGIASFIMLIMAIRLRRQDVVLPWLSALALFLIGFEAWLGATVVESNLEPAKITTHMIGAIIIIAVMLAIFRRARYGTALPSSTVARSSKVLLLTAIAATIIQILIGTQVREHVDSLDKAWNGESRDQWIAQIGTIFQVHALFAYAVILLNLVLVYLLRRSSYWQSVRRTAMLILGLLAIEWVTGASLSLFGIPAFIQPAHLIIATLIFGLQFRLWEELRYGKSRTETALPGAEQGPASVQVSGVTPG